MATIDEAAEHFGISATTFRKYTDKGVPNLATKRAGKPKLS